jgi:hypothetical protein
VISQARTALVNLLTTAGFRTFDYVPPNITPPCAVIFPSDVYIAGGETVGEYRVGYDVRIFAQNLTNEKVTGVMDQYIEDALIAVNDEPGFYLEAIGAPEMYQENNASFLGVQFTVYQLKRP